MEKLQINTEKIEEWIAAGYDVLQDGKLIKVEGNLQEFLQQFADDTADGGPKIYLLKELLTWPEEDLKKIEMGYGTDENT
ncbi:MULTISPECIES: hypothetical protein [Sphingobacterium]|uniref:hypothetical protein n=1 Tax=Sphingobacterium TaxID=28453 RepID=UPI00095D9D51|nr:MULTISPECIES: hypothetical protein [Sphingobacterium]OJZ12256.1 MAG: hypothetical protein BGP15_20960 [Sphingobacterium sp. 40-24]QQT62928.1 hypothetical protein I6I97_03685 [Sphingobacterium multivorum]